MERNDWKSMSTKPKPNFPIEAEVERDLTKCDESWWPRGTKGHLIDLIRVEKNLYRSILAFRRNGGIPRHLNLSGNRIVRWRYKPNYLENMEE